MRQHQADELVRAVRIAAELVAARLNGLPAVAQQHESSAMLARHLHIRDVVGRVLLLSRERYRLAKARSVPVPNTVAAEQRALHQCMIRRTDTRERKEGFEVTTALGDGIVELWGTVLAFSLVEHQDEDPSFIVDVLAAEAECDAPSDIDNIIRVAHRAAHHACERGHDTRATIYAAVLMTVAGLVDHFSMASCMALSMFSMPPDFIFYMVSAQASKSKAPQQVTALALNILGFPDAVVYNVLLTARRVHDPRATIDRAQVRRLTRVRRTGNEDAGTKQRPSGEHRYEAKT